jgi:hypothetical protein
MRNKIYELTVREIVIPNHYSVVIVADDGSVSTIFTDEVVSWGEGLKKGSKVYHIGDTRVTGDETEYALILPSLDRKALVKFCEEKGL